MPIVTVPFNNYAASKTRAMTIGAQTGVATYATAAAAPGTAISVPASTLKMRFDMAPGRSLRRLQLSVGAEAYDMQANGDVLRAINPATGAGTLAGAVTQATGEVSLSHWPTAAPALPTAVRAAQAPPTEGLSAPFMASTATFRTAAAPIRPGSLSVQGNLQDGTAFNVTADTQGRINSARVKGRVSYEYGLVELFFTNPAITDPLAPQHDVAHLGIAGVAAVPEDLARTPTLRYNAVSYTYLPLDAGILGLDPVRLPSDGRVPVFKPGRVVLVHNTVAMTPQTVANGQTVDCGRTRLARLRVLGSDGLEISSGFAKNLDLGTVTFTNVAGFAQPVTVEHRVEDESLCAEAQITGDIRLQRPLTHSFPAPGTYVSSAMVMGTRQAAVQDAFAQEAWTAEWSDVRIGNPMLAAYNDTAHPIVVTNAGAATERWAIVFTSNTTFNVTGEAVGQIISGDTGTTLAPVDPYTGVPYFTLSPAGWGSGWAAGNVLRFNTVGAAFPFWASRTVLQSPAAPPGSDRVTISIRGDIDQ